MQSQLTNPDRHYGPGWRSPEAETLRSIDILLNLHIATQATRRFLQGLFHRESKFDFDEALLPFGAVQIGHLRLRGFRVCLV